MSVTNKTLLVTADDYGVHDCIDNGIRECLHNIDCIDVIVTHHSSKSRIQRLLKDHKQDFIDGKLRLGLHLTLTCGSPQYTEDKKYLRSISKDYTRDIIVRREFRHTKAICIIPKLDNLIRNHATALENEIRAQYDTFIEITRNVIHEMKDIQPTHISAHLGIYNATEDLYNMLKRVCIEKKIPMRAPTLLFYYTDSDMNPWTEHKQKLLPEWKLDAMLLFQNGLKINNWIRSQQEYVFAKDRNEEQVVGTEFFIEHFFKQGCLKQLTAILRRIKNNPSDREHSYEMVVHPVSFKHKDELKSLPRGIDANSFAKRKIEFEFLKKAPLRDMLQKIEIDTYEYPSV